MKKIELLSVIIGKISKIDHYIDILEYENQEEFYLFKEILFGIKATLLEMKNDVEENIIPVEFFVKINSILSQVYIEEYDPPAEASWESFKQRLLDINLQRLIAVTIIYKFYKDLNFISNNTVIVGANGSGKSILASNIKNNLSEKIVTVIPAQKLLIIPTFDGVPNLKKTLSEYKNFETTTIDNKITYNASYLGNLPYDEAQKYTADFRYILNTLFSERIYIQNIIYEDFNCKGNNEEMKREDYPSIRLDKAIRIWNYLIEHREMFYDNKNNNLKIRDKGSASEYFAYQMSDGEKEVFFLIGKILLTSKEAIIIIDEPEMYLHKVIVNKLWDILEQEREDCKFIYLTHDLEFASSRRANKYWIKGFQFPSKWEIEPIPKNNIPDSLLMKILGSRKKILFCEGIEGSIDVKIYEILFPNYTIISSGGCSNVINYTRAFNKLPNINTVAIGIVDRDFRPEAQIDKFKSENIYVYSVAEIENLFLLEEFIRIFSERKDEEIDIQCLKKKILDKLEGDKEQQISNYVTSYINYIFSEEHVKKAKNQEEIKSNLDNFISKIKTDILYNNRKEEIEEIIKNEDYLGAIKIYNNKGLLKEVESLLKYKSGKYSEESLKILRGNKEAQQVLRIVFPQEIISDEI